MSISEMLKKALERKNEQAIYLIRKEQLKKQISDSKKESKNKLS